MRIVGKKDWNPIAASPEEAMRRGARLDALMQSLTLPDFRPRGVFRGPRSMFEAMETERIRKIKEWLDAHSRPA